MITDKQASPLAGQGETHALRYHDGAVLYHLASTYDNLTKTLVEAVQNAVDADAQTVVIGIDVRAHLVMVMDDGVGITVDRFSRALNSVGLSIKNDDPEALGEFGLGLIAPVPKCRTFTVWSRPMGLNEVNQWTFRGEDIRKQNKITIPYKSSQQPPRPPKQFVKLISELRTGWRTILRLEGVTTDRTISQVDLNDLEAQILTKLGRGMRRKGTIVYVVLLAASGELTTREIKPGTVTGEPLPVIEYDDDELCGKVIFRLFRAPIERGRRKGQVEVLKLGGKAAVGWADFRFQAMASKWLFDAKAAFDSLGSGFLEGRIEIENFTLNPTRDRFVLDDALKATYMAIDTWFRQHGQAYYEEERDLRRDRRYIELGERSLERLLEHLRHNPLLAGMTQGLIGRLPEYDTDPPKPKQRSPEPGQGKRKKAVAQQRRSRPKPGQAFDRLRAPNEGAANFTISFAYEPNPESMLLFDFELATGLITFNILHPVWVMLDETKDGRHLAKHDRQIMKLQEWLAFKILFLLSHQGTDRFEQLRDTIDKEVEYYAPLFCEE